MIKVHCNQIGEFILAHVINWYVLCALAVPVLFSLLFPVYWFIICPHIWAENPQLYNARSWLIAYWLFGIVVWLVFLFVVFYKSMRDHSNEISSSCHKGGGAYGGEAGTQRLDSTEDLWSEDQYLPDSYLPSPDYMVSLNAVQPSVTLEDKQEVDETWDYNYEDASPQNGSPSGDRFPLEQHYHSLGYINAKLQQGSGGDIWRKYSEPSPTFCSSQSAKHASSPQYPHPIRFGKDSHTTTTTDDDDSVYDYRYTAASSRRSRSGNPAPSHSGSFHHPPLGPRRPPSARHLRPLRYLNSPGYHRGRAQSTSTSTTTDSGADSPAAGRYQRFVHNSRRRHAPTCPRSRHIPIPPVKRQVMITRPPAPPVKRVSGTRSALFASKEESESDDIEQMKRSVTSEELKCLQDVCQGKLARKGSIVDDSKFDSILASLQSLASDLEKDFEYVPPAVDLKKTLQGEEDRNSSSVQSSKTKFQVSPVVSLKSERTKSEGDFDDIPDSITTKME